MSQKRMLSAHSLVKYKDARIILSGGVCERKVRVFQERRKSVDSGDADEENTLVHPVLA
jgi:hypothetical protein